MRVHSPSMKLALILMFLSYWIHVKAQDNFKACQGLSYFPGSDDDLQNKFKNEYSFTQSAKKTFHNLFTHKGSPSFKIEGKLAKFFCVCAFYKLERHTKVENSENDEKSLKSLFDNINQEMFSNEENLGMYIWPYSMGFIYEHQFPATYCGTNGKRYLVAKGPDKKPDPKQLYDIYVAKIIKWYKHKEPIYDMKGYIKDVDLENLQREIS